MIPARKTPAAVKHAVYSSLAVLPGEDEGAFKKLQTRLSDEYAPSGPSEEAIVTELAGVLWRKQHLSTFQKAKDLQARAAYLESLQRYKVSNITVMAIPICITLDARDCAREEMGEENFALVDNPSATFDQLERELDLTD